MPRKARRREKHLPHHIMSRSIPELNLFQCDEDKEYYLTLLKKSSQVYRVDVLAYCLMDNHVHILVHPQGGDISKFMKNINNPYARYYNRTYDRRGHLYGDRFKNIVIEDEVQLLRTSTYIHNNAKDLLWQGYRSIDDYPFSSINDYISPNRGRGIVKTDILFSFLNGEGERARNHYKVLLEIQSQGHEKFEKEVEKAFNKGSYESDRKSIVRDVEPEKVICVVAEILGIKDVKIAMYKFARKTKNLRALTTISLRIYCNMTTKEIANVFKGYTSSGISNLSREGYKLLEVKPELCDQIEALLI